MKKFLQVWDYFSNLGVHPSLSDRDFRITKLINQFAFSLLSVILISFIWQVCFHLIKEGYIFPQSILMIVTFSPIGLIFFLNQKRKYTIARLVFIIHPLINTIIWMIVSTSNDANIHYSYLLFPIPIVILFREFRMQIFLTVLAYAAFIISHYLGKMNLNFLQEYQSSNFAVIAFGIWLGFSFLMLRFFVREIEVAENKLKQKNLELEEFARVASHDLKEPLRTIGSFSQLVKNRYKNDMPEEASEYLDYVESGVKRLNDLITDLGTYSFIGNLDEEMERVDLNDIFDHVILDLQAKIIERDAKVKRTELPTILAYPSNMTQLFQNLINNGLKFQPFDKNHIPQISVDAVKQGPFFILNFMDNGIGISKENHKSIFTKFKRLHSRREYEGTGLGMATCQKIVEQHKGSISVSSEIGKGTSIAVKLLYLS